MNRHSADLTGPDFDFQNHGSVCLLTPLNAAAQEWLDENLSGEVMHWGNAVAIEPRYAEDILNGIVEDGLAIE